jgi:LuxR family maltose regulon positive regulatory protein
MLHSIERANLFLIPLDNQRAWYRYHHLFAELLQHRLQKEKNRDFLNALHRAASRWFEAHGYILEAAKHAFQTPDWDYAAGLVERHAMTLISRSQVGTVLEWYNQLPASVLNERPLACIYMAWALVLIFREDYRPAVEEWLQRAERALQHADLPLIVSIGPEGELVRLQEFVTGQVCAIRSQNLLASFREPVDPQTLVALSQRALELLPETARFERSVCAINLALAHLILSQITEAEGALAKAYRLALEVGNYYTAVTTVWYQARLAFYTGRFPRAYEICIQGKEEFDTIFEQAKRDFPAIRSITVVEAMARLEQNQLEQAEKLLEGCLDLTGWATWVELWAFAALVRLRQAQRDLAGALRTLERMEKMGPQHAICAQALRVLHFLRHSSEDGRWREHARLWAEAHEPYLETYGVVLGLGPYHCDTLYIKDLTWAHIQVALGQAQPAIAFVEPVLAVARQQDLTYRIVELCVLLAMAQSVAGDLPAALDTLQEALALGELHGYIRVFDQGSTLDQLLAKAAQRGSTMRFVQRLAAEFDRLERSGPTITTKHQKAQLGLIEPLSERELEVLRLIAAGHSNAEIAAKLFIAFGTVKRHINNIYGKLGVKSRTQAVDKARQLVLLP